MDVRVADLTNFGLNVLKMISDSGARLIFAPYDGLCYNMLGNRAISITPDGEGRAVNIPISLSDCG